MPIKNSLIVYFTTTGNTGMLAESLHQGLTEEGVTSVLKNVDCATVEEVDDYELLCLGCSASGTEELDDTEFDPYFESILPKLANKKVFLFGCYGWGNGEFMNIWQQRAQAAKAVLVHEPFVHLETPNQAGLDEIKEIGKKLTK